MKTKTTRANKGMKYILWTLKLLLVLIFSFSYLCMMKILYCGCWACKIGVAIGILGLLLGLWDRAKEIYQFRDR